MNQAKNPRHTHLPIAVLCVATAIRLWSVPSVAAAPDLTVADPLTPLVCLAGEKPLVVLETKVVRRFKTVVTAYNSLPEQTDSTPCTTANGYDLCAANEENVVAANFLRFGTKVRLPEYSGEKIYTVQDRMHPRFAQRVDLWMREREDAKQFGMQTLTVEVVE
ncbi:MAG: hypothetical protein PHI63_02385 [Patescibacteria group bacterium]|nr:hypothetical protein [Patescibacteria group bacterium]